MSRLLADLAVVGSGAGGGAAIAGLRRLCPDRLAFGASLHLAGSYRMGERRGCDSVADFECRVRGMTIFSPPETGSSLGGQHAIRL